MDHISQASQPCPMPQPQAQASSPGDMAVSMTPASQTPSQQLASTPKLPAHPSLAPKPFQLVMDQGHHPIPLSQHSQQQLQLALSHCLAASTSNSYVRTVKRFLLFCSHKWVPCKHHWPDNELSLCTFAASHTQNVAGSTVKGYMAALKAWHATNNMPWHGSARLSYILKGIHNVAPSSSEHGQRPPITQAMLHILHKSLKPNDSFDCAVL